MATTDSAVTALPELGAYEVLAPIARGGMAEVYLARLRSHPERLVALKIMRAEFCRNQEFVAMFLDEARIASRLAHANIAAIYGLGTDRGHQYLAMELLRGRTLLDVVDIALRRGGRLPYEVVAWVGARIADALHYAHELRDPSGTPLDVVHRDVNPSNIFVTFDGTPKLIDFGLAKARDRITSTAHGILKGKLAYLAPEQITGAPLDRRVDIFALGVSLWEVSIGDRLFREDSDVETVRRVSRAEVPDPVSRDANFPRALADIILRALARAPQDRYRTAQDLSRALDGFVRESGRTVEAREVGALVRTLFPSSSPLPWETLADSLSHRADAPALGRTTSNGSLVQAWDDDAQKMTWMAVDSREVVAAAAAMAPTALPTRAMTLSAMPWREGFEAALAERLASMPADDSIGRARALLECALLDEWLADGSRALQYAEASASASPSPAAFSAIRRLRRSAATPTEAGALVPLLDQELALTTAHEIRADLLAERGRLLQVAGDRAAAKQSFLAALQQSINHPAAMKGLEVVLRSDPREARELASHLGRMADALEPETTLSAWLGVERARVFDRELGLAGDAKSALSRALSLDPGLGPVRWACVAHARDHRDAAWLVTLLLDEAEREPEPTRGASLEFEAAIVCRHRLADEGRAAAILEKARLRRVEDLFLRRVILDELITLHDRASHTEASLAGRRERLGLIESDDEKSVELLALAVLEERRGRLEAAAAVIKEARRATPNDESLLFELDRILEKMNDTASRAELWAIEAAEHPDADFRVRAVKRAADLSERSGNWQRSIELHRATLTMIPADLEAVDALDRLLRMQRSEQSLEEARGRIAVHRHAAEHASELERRIAHLEVAALLEEEELADPSLASATYETIVALSPQRRSALVGLARTARRAGDSARSAKALLAEAELTASPAEKNRLRVRAAALLAESDGERAAKLLATVLATDEDDVAAREAKLRVHERSESWTLADRELDELSKRARTNAKKTDLRLTRAALQRFRLGAPLEALKTVGEVLGGPDSSATARAISVGASMVDDLEGESAEDALLFLAGGAKKSDVRARLLLRAATLAEYVRGDDGRALDLMTRARGETPRLAWLDERLRGIARRVARSGDAAPYVRALEQAAQSVDGRAARCELALVRLGSDPESAVSLVEAIARDNPGAPYALRLLELTASATGRVPLLANALSNQVESFATQAARLGPLWEELRLMEWSLGADARSELDRARSLAIEDRAVLDGVLRSGIPLLRAGDEGRRAALVEALRTLAAQATDDTSRLASVLALALALLPTDLTSKPTHASREALAAVRDALRIDPQSVLAAVGAARLGPLLGDPEAAAAGLMSLADVSPSLSRRAELLTQAAGTLASGSEAAVGRRAERLARAAELLERALDADPESILAATMLFAVRSEDGQRERLLVVLGGALERAKSKDAIVSIGMELARAARETPETRLRAVDALRRVVAAAPRDASAWRALAEVYLETGARADAAHALEAVAANAREPREKSEALFGLVDLYRQSGAQADVERALRVAIDVDPSSARALRELIDVRRAVGAPREEVIGLLRRLADVAKPGEEKSLIYSDLADVEAASGDRSKAEQSLIEASAQSPSASRLARVLDFYAGNPGEQARLLSAVVARGEQLGRPDAAAWAALGALEVDSLKQTREGVAHLKRALALEPARPEARASLARGLSALGNRDEAASTVMGMLVPESAPLLSLRDPVSPLAVLEKALVEQGKRDESRIIRELRAIGGGLDDGAHVELRARRATPIDVVPGALDAARIAGTLVPEKARGLALALTSALGGVDAKIYKTDLESLEINPRQRITSSNGHAIAATVAWLSRLFGIDAPPIVLSSRIPAPRTVCVDGDAWLAVPPNLTSKPEPEETALLVRPLVRITLALPWLDDLSSQDVHALLCGIARRVAPGYADELRELDQSRAEDFSQRVGRAIGRKQKKALSDLTPRLQDAKPLSLNNTQAFQRAVNQAEARAAFIVTGDLLATLDALRATDAALARETNSVGARALGMTLTQPVTSDLVRFALSSTALSMRTRLGTA